MDFHLSLINQRLLPKCPNFLLFLFNYTNTVILKKEWNFWYLISFLCVKITKNGDSDIILRQQHGIEGKFKPSVAIHFN